MSRVASATAFACSRHALFVGALLANALSFPLRAQQAGPHVLTVDEGRRAGIRLGADTVDSYNSQEGVKKPAGIVITNSTFINIAGRPTYLVAMAVISPTESQSYDTLAVDAATFVPLWHRTHSPTDSAAITIAEGRATGWRVPARQSRKEISFALTDVMFETGVAEAMRWRLPWAFGYAVSISSVGMWESRPMTTVFRTVGSEMVEWRGKRVDVWVVAEGAEAQPHVVRKHWIDKETGALLQSHTALASFANPTDGYWVKRR